MIKILISGKGKMGNEIIKEIKNKRNIKIIKIIERKDKIEKIKKVDIVIDFSNRKRTMKIIKKCAQEKKKIIIGTTGFKRKQIKKINSYSKNIAIFFEYNINKIFHKFIKIIKYSKKVLKGFDKHIIETHNKKKKDKPSGSYKLICKQTKEKIKCSSVRIGDIIAKHEIIFNKDNNTIKIEHEVYRREAIAKSIVEIIKFIKKKKKGKFNMNDILNSKKNEK